MFSRISNTYTYSKLQVQLIEKMPLEETLFIRQPEQLTFWIAASIPGGMRRGRTLVLHL